MALKGLIRRGTDVETREENMLVSSVLKTTRDTSYFDQHKMGKACVEHGASVSLRISSASEPISKKMPSPCEDDVETCVENVLVSSVLETSRDNSYSAGFDTSNMGIACVVLILRLVLGSICLAQYRT